MAYETPDEEYKGGRYDRRHNIADRRFNRRWCDERHTAINEEFDKLRWEVGEVGKRNRELDQKFDGKFNKILILMISNLVALGTLTATLWLNLGGQLPQ